MVCFYGHFNRKKGPIERAVRADKPPHEQKELLVAIIEKVCSLRCLLGLCHLVRGGEEHLDVLGIGVVSCSNGTNIHGDSALNMEVGLGPRERLVVHNGACKAHGKVELGLGLGLFSDRKITAASAPGVARRYYQ